LKKVLGTLLVKDVGRSHLSATLDAMTRKGIKEETRKALTTLNLMLDYALARHLIDQNPARMLKPKDFSATANRPRDRVLSSVELRQLWLALDQSFLSMAATTAIALKLLILTGARRGEVAGMRWQN
jgi:integrase